MANDTNTTKDRMNNIGSGRGNQGTDSTNSRNVSNPKADEIARDIGQHADDGVRTNSLEKDGAKQAPSRNER